MTAADQKDRSDGVKWFEGESEESWYDDEAPADGVDDAEPDDDGPAESEIESESESGEEPDALDEDEEESEESEEAESEAEVESKPTAEKADLDKQRGRRRSKTIARKQMLRERRRLLAQGSILEILEYDRPYMRSQCREEKRPCLYVSCRYHLYLDVNPVTGSIKLNFPDKEPWDLAQTCALDVAERGGITLEEVGDIMNLTRERIRQVEVSGLDKLKRGETSLHTFVDGHELDPPGSWTGDD